MNKAKNRKIAFLDRDGIINVDHGYVFKVSDFQFVDGFVDLFRSLIDNDYLPVVVTNQSGVARGYYNLDQVDEFHAHLNIELENLTGSKIEYFYVCPHHTGGSVDNFSGECTCRKPLTGMIDNFEKDYSGNIDFENSIMLGDKKSDVQLGLNKKLISIQFDSGKYELHKNPTHIVKDLKEVIKILK